MSDAENNPFPADRSHFNRRTLDRDRATCFGAWSDPRRLAQWWGPDGFRNTIQEFDFREGGTIRLTMHAPDGSSFPNEWRVESIAPNERLVLRHLDPARGTHVFRLHATFEDAGPGRTTLTLHNVYDEAEEYARVRDFIRPADEQMLARLQSVLSRKE